MFGRQKRGKPQIKTMVKVQKISEIKHILGFIEFDIRNKYCQSFICSELGRLHSVLPFKELAPEMSLKDSRLGRKSDFFGEGKIALMILKTYIGFSDLDLIKHLNGNIHYTFIPFYLTSFMN